MAANKGDDEDYNSDLHLASLELLSDLDEDEDCLSDLHLATLELLSDMDEDENGSHWPLPGSFGTALSWIKDFWCLISANVADNEQEIKITGSESCDLYMLQQTRSELFQITARHIIITKLLSELMLIHQPQTLQKCST